MSISVAASVLVLNMHFEKSRRRPVPRWLKRVLFIADKPPSDIENSCSALVKTNKALMAHCRLDQNHERHTSTALIKLSKSLRHLSENDMCTTALRMANSPSNNLRPLCESALNISASVNDPAKQHRHHHHLKESRSNSRINSKGSYDVVKEGATATTTKKQQLLQTLLEPQQQSQLQQQPQQSAQQQPQQQQQQLLELQGQNIRKEMRSLKILIDALKKNLLVFGRELHQIEKDRFNRTLAEWKEVASRIDIFLFFASALTVCLMPLVLFGKFYFVDGQIFFNSRSCGCGGVH